MSDEVDKLRARAAKARRLLYGMTDDTTRDALRAIAEECEEKVAAIGREADSSLDAQKE